MIRARSIYAILVAALCSSAWATTTATPTARQVAVDRGVQFLIDTQNDDGSWGTFRSERHYNVYAPVPGGLKSFKTGSTALAVSGLLRAASQRPDALEAARKGARWLQSNIPKLRRDAVNALYCNWGFLFGIEALLDYAPHASWLDRQKSKRAIKYAIDRLTRYRSIRGGWGYYDFNYTLQQNAGWPASFMTAAALASLSKAKAAGYELPDDLLTKGTEELRRCRLPDNAFLYNFQWQYHPRADGNRPAGSLGRTQVGLYGLRVIGGKAEVTDKDLRVATNRFVTRNDWLGMGRKRPKPHESWFQVAGYYYCMGHSYAARCIDLLPAEEQEPFRERQAAILLKSQEKDGSWWDFPLYGFGKAYGTGFILQALAER